MHDAMDVAEYILFYSQSILSKKITNLQLQKFLYYVQGASLAINKNEIFDNPIIAWRYGPVVPDVYYSYNRYGSRKIEEDIVDNSFIFSIVEREIIENVIKKLINIDPWKVVRQTHKEEPWILNESTESEMCVDEIGTWFKTKWSEIWQVYQ